MSLTGLTRLAGSAVVLAALAIFPLVFTNPSVTTIAVFTLLFMASATAWNGFAGYTGYIALGHAAFFGTGAYVLAIVAQRLGVPGGSSMFALVPLAGLGAAVVAIPFGLVALRTRRHTFVVITIAVFFIFQLLAFNLSITQGSSGDPGGEPKLGRLDLQQPLLLCRPGDRPVCHHGFLGRAAVRPRPPAARHPR